ncbi:MAG: hypothetical protein K2W96_13280 [Gemmataceae bacterium]|nr:hypothetical protein [Gemmataceae bacterium]
MLFLLLLAADPLPIGHRGLPTHAPENTLPAFRACLALRVGFEFDVRKSKDGHLVVMHDDTLDRTTDGKGAVAGKTLAELKKLDAGRWFGPAFAKTRIPTLDEVFALLRDEGRDGVACLVDIKADGIEAGIVASAKKHGVLDRIVCIGNAIESPAVRRKLREADASVPVAVLANAPADLEKALAAKDADWAYLRFVPDDKQRTAIRVSGKKLLLVGKLFMGREPANWAKARAAGADALLTDHPLECREGWRVGGR